jgi:DNA-binding CsgD family transcriptional regulator
MPRTPTKMTSKNATRRQAVIDERQQQAFRLWRYEKKSYRAIGDILGYSHEMARQDINAVLDKVADEFEDEVRVWKTKQLRRLMDQYSRFDTIAGGEKNSMGDRTRAGQLCLNILKEINDLIGVKSAIKHEVSTTADVSSIASEVVQRLIDAGWNESDAREQAAVLYPEVSNVSNAIN